MDSAALPRAVVAVLQRLHMGVSIRSRIKLARTVLPRSEVVVLCWFVESYGESMPQCAKWCFRAQTEIGVSFVECNPVITRFT